MFDWIGWLATAVFASSYACREPVTLRRVQGLAALMWLVYGALIHAVPVVVANVIVAGAAIWSSFARPVTAAPQRVTADDPLPSDQG
jgi:hypothetical protein